MISSLEVLEVASLNDLNDAFLVDVEELLVESFFLKDVRKRQLAEVKSLEIAAKDPQKEEEVVLLREVGLCFLGVDDTD
jgi:hypothetical protein